MEALSGARRREVRVERNINSDEEDVQEGGGGKGRTRERYT